MDCREIDLKKHIKKMKAITTWFFTGGGSGGDVRGLTNLSLKSRTGPSSYKRTIMSVSYHMKLFNKFITTISIVLLTLQASFLEVLEKQVTIVQQ